MIDNGDGNMASNDRNTHPDNGNIRVDDRNTPVGDVKSHFGDKSIPTMI